MSKERLDKLLNEFNIPIEKIVNPIRLKWSKDNFNNILSKNEIPDCIKNATLNEIFATCPFS